MVNTYTQLAWDGPTLEDACHLIRLAVREDLSNQQDWTTMATVGDERTSKAAIVARQPGIVAGIGIVAAVFEEMNIPSAVELHVAGTRGDGFSVIRCHQIELEVRGRLVTFCDRLGVDAELGGRVGARGHLGVHRGLPR